MANTTTPAAVATAAALMLTLSACGDKDTDSKQKASTDPKAASNSSMSGSPMTEAAKNASPSAPDKEISVSDGWVRSTDSAGADEGMSAAFMKIANKTGKDVRLVSGTSKVAGVVQIHGMKMTNGKMAMYELPGGLKIANGMQTTLMPGGNHVMLMRLKTKLHAGEEAKLTLKFNDGSTKELTLPIRKFTAEEPHYHGKATENAK